MRVFEVLGQRFELPILKLRKQLDRAATLRRRLGATWFEALTEPVVGRFSSEESRTARAFERARRVLDAHEDVVFAALEHVTVYENALALATRMVSEKATTKVDGLAMRAQERQRIAAQASGLAVRVDEELGADLGLIHGRMLAIGKAAHLMLTRLETRREHVLKMLARLEERREELAKQGALLNHDEHNWYFREELRRDGDLDRWLRGPDRICESVEGALRHLVGELEGIEARIEAMPETVERVLAKVDGETPRSAPDLQSLLDLEGFGTLTAVGREEELPRRLDDDDWDKVLAHEQDAELLAEKSSVAALASALQGWLKRAVVRRRGGRRCATCEGTFVGGTSAGRAHLMCAGCREKARTGGMDWLGRVGFGPTAQRGMRDGGLVTHVVFESVMDYVPSVGPAQEPVTRVSWREAVAFCNALSRREGLEAAYEGGRSVRLRSEVGWRLPDSLESRDMSKRKAGVREWLFASREGGGEREIGPGLRLIAASDINETTGRAVADAREDDVGFRCVSPVRRVAPVPRAEVATPKRAKVARRRAPSPRKMMQILGLGALVSAATGLVIGEFVPDRPVMPASDQRTAGEPASIEAGPAGQVETSTGAQAPSAPSERETRIGEKLEAAEKARLKKDRKGALRLYEEALELEPGHLEARYGAAREAGALRDANVAFMHLEVLVASENPEARELLKKALKEPEFTRLGGNPRWKKLEKVVQGSSPP